MVRGNTRRCTQAVLIVLHRCYLINCVGKCELFPSCLIVETVTEASPEMYYSNTAPTACIYRCYRCFWEDYWLQETQRGRTAHGIIKTSLTELPTLRNDETVIYISTSQGNAIKLVLWSDSASVFECVIFSAMHASICYPLILTSSMPKQRQIQVRFHYTGI
ncbi:hypothetical protein F5146DRAFT_382233 [Armillaria mellea]|nr:hypothetical protein F5146DRAFT_382233 [Armillaria mellea]